MFGLSMDKVIVILVIAVVIIGPQRLPAYAAKLAQLVKTLRGMADTAKARMSEEMGPEFDDVDWKKLDPRQYDPRRIIRSALLDDDPAPVIKPPSRDPAHDEANASANENEQSAEPRKVEISRPEVSRPDDARLDDDFNGDPLVGRAQWKNETPIDLSS